LSKAAEAVSNLLEGNRRQIEADAQRLPALINEVADRIGEAKSVRRNPEMQLPMYFPAVDAYGSCP